MRTLLTLSLIVAALVFSACGDDGTFSVKTDATGSGQTDDRAATDDEDSNQEDDESGQMGTDGTSNANDQNVEDEMDDAACPEALQMCGAACVDTAQSDDHCGTCGMACPAGTECASSECACTDGGDLCGDSCVDTETNAQHCGSCGNVCMGGMACVDGGCVSLTEVAGVLSATNAARAAGQDCGQYGMFGPAPALEADPHLAEAAQVHAVDMATNNFFSHTGSDGSSFVDRVRRTDYSGFPIGENIAGGGTDPAGVVQRWIDSDGHCRNLMNPQATKLGVGFTEGGPYRTMWVQVFGR